MPDKIWEPRPKLRSNGMPWKVAKRGSEHCVIRESDGKTVKCHPTAEKAKSHIAALYANEPSAAKKGLAYSALKSLIMERVEELKACGANKPGGGGFATGNTCARGGGGGSQEKLGEGNMPFKHGDLVVAKKSEQGLVKGASYTVAGTRLTEDPNYKGPAETLKKTGGDYFLRPHQDSQGRYTFSKGNDFEKAPRKAGDVPVKYSSSLLKKHEESGVKAPSPSPYNVARRKITGGG